MKKRAVRFELILFLSLAGFILVGTASGYLYRQNKNYQNENRRLIILNDSILSENIELKNALQSAHASAINSEKVKTNKNK